MIDITTLVVASKAAVLTLGALIVCFAYRAFRRTGSAALRSVAVGFGAITLGAVLGGALHQLFDVGFALGLMIDSALTTVGFAVLAYSLFVRDGRIGADDPAPPAGQ